MLPSRGLRWSSQTVGIGRRRLEQVSTRHFSSSIVQNAPIRSNPLLSERGASTSRIYTKSPFSRTNLLIRNGAGIRFASTTPLATSPAASPATPDPSQAVSSSAAVPAAPAPPAEVVPSSIDNAIDFTTGSLYEIPEHIGYLKSLGLDYGWGPTACIEWLLEHVHIFAGTPWWVSISLTAIIIRAILFKPYIDAADNAARMQAVQPITQPLTKQMTAVRGDTTAVLQIRSEIQAIHRRAGIKMWKSLVPMTQMVAGYGTFVLLRAMGKLPVPGLETGGALWFHNLTIPDPFFIMPAATAFVLHMVLKGGGETAATTMSPQAMKVMTYVFPSITFLFTAFMPAALQVSFFVSGLLAFGQARLFRLPAFRSYFNMYPLTTPGAAKPTPYKGTMKVRAPMTQAELNRTYQGSRSVTTASHEIKAEQPAPQAPGKENPIKKFVVSTVQGTVKDISGTVKDVTQSAKDLLGKGKEGLKERQLKSERAAAAAYEEKRQKEIRQERYEREQQRRAEREARRMRDEES